MCCNLVPLGYDKMLEQKSLQRERFYFSLQSQATVHLCEEVKAAGTLKTVIFTVKSRGVEIKLHRPEFLAEGMVPTTVGRFSHLM